MLALKQKHHITANVPLIEDGEKILSIIGSVGDIQQAHFYGETMTLTVKATKKEWTEILDELHELILKYGSRYQ